jgi:hypothetical protein
VLAGRKKEEQHVAGLLLWSWWRVEQRRVVLATRFDLLFAHLEGRKRKKRAIGDCLLGGEKLMHEALALSFFLSFFLIYA